MHTQRVILFTYLILSFTILINAQAITDRERQGFHGAVKSVIVESGFIDKINNQYIEGARRYPSYSIEFDQQGNVTKPAILEICGNELPHTHTYDQNGNLIKEEVHDWQGTLKYRYTYSYNAANLLLESKHYDANGHHFRTWKYTYRYDANGNWVKQLAAYQDVDLTVGNLEFIPRRVEYRTISYYQN